MGARREAMHEVELTEEDGLAPGESPGTAEPRVLRRSDLVAILRWLVAASRRFARAVRALGRGVVRGRRWWPVVPALAVVAGLVVGGNHVVEQRREAAQVRREAALDLLETDYLASLVDTPGVLAPVDETVHELWRADPAGLAETTWWERFGDRLVGTALVDGGYAVVVLDPETGAQMWSHNLAAPINGSWSSCFGAGDEPASLLVCQRRVEQPTGSVGVTPGDLSEDGSVAVALDLLTGESRGSFAMTDEATLVPFDGDVVSLEPTDSGTTLVTRREPTTGEPAWTYELAAPSARAADGEPVDGLATFAAMPFGIETVDELVVGVPGGGVVLLGSDGHVERELAPRGTTLDDLLSVGIDVSDDRALVMQRDGGEVVTTDLRTGTEHPGVAMGWRATAADDGSLGTAVLADDGDLLTFADLESGSTWVADDVGDELVGWYVLDRRVVVQGLDEVAAYDGATGDELWRAPSRRWSTSGDGSSYLGAAPTDGRSIVVVERGADAGTRVLAATALRDGRRSWAVRVADDVVGVRELGGRLYGVLKGGGIAALG